MIPQNDLLLNPNNTYKKFKELIDIYRENIGTNDTFYYKYLLEEIRNTSFWNLYSMSYKCCTHVYKNGKKYGEVCGAKVFIETNDKLQKYLCSRHCRDYDTKKRIYNKDNIRCNYIRNNGEQCKHKCNKYKKYCYIHKKEEEEHIESLEIAPPNFNDSNIYKNLYSEDLSLKNIFLEKLRKRRHSHFLKRHNKYKNINKNNKIIIKYNKILKILKIQELYNFSKIFFKCNNYNYYNKIRFK